MDKDNLISLDKQEGVGIGFYSPLDVTINTDEGEVLCRTYQMNNFTVHQTSPPYKQVVFVLEQNKTGLPLDYIKKLEAVETNGYSGPSILDDITALKPADKGKSL
ncbi:gamma-glutamylcyclotransferase-like [Oncorhynchus mykiss]|uniref:gamma-glutamylcyclotransferase-like n=1 Tax=Oncorhynchus mykiss TaxID=8022 RepID=UPI001878BAF6|nr:gamma-glutamylcyclotransferase-like [Oncorhynchus mykiss]